MTWSDGEWYVEAIVLLGVGQTLSPEKKKSESREEKEEKDIGREKKRGEQKAGECVRFAHGWTLCLWKTRVGEGEGSTAFVMNRLLDVPSPESMAGHCLATFAGPQSLSIALEPIRICSKALVDDTKPFTELHHNQVVVDSVALVSLLLITTALSLERRS